MGESRFRSAMSNTNRLRVVMLTGLLFWALILHNLFSFRLRVIAKHESLGYLLERVPGGLLSISSATFTIAIGLAFAVYLLPRRLALHSATPQFAAALGAFFLVTGGAFVWLQPDHPVPQEPSGAVSFLVGISLLLFSALSSKRLLLQGHLVLLIAALAVGALSHLRPGHREKTEALRQGLQTALVELERQQRAWNELKPTTVLLEARERASRFNVYRFDDHLSDIKDLETSNTGSQDGVLLELPRDDKFVGMSPTPSSFTSESSQVFPEYPGESFLRNETPLAVDPMMIGSIQVRMKISKGSYFQLFWSEDDRMSLADGIRMPLATPGKATTYEIKDRIIRHRGKGRINYFWLVPSDEDATVEIEFFRVLDRTGGMLGGLPFVVGYENVEEEIRRVLVVSVPSRITYEVNVPRVRARLLFGISAPSEELPTTFEVSIRSKGNAKTVFSLQIRGTPRWYDHEIDLGDWAGETVDVTFTTTAHTQSVGLWSNPVVLGEKAPRPNVVIFLVDTLRADHLGAYGYARNTSPVFDTLAASGVLFERAFSNGTMTKHAIPGLFSSNPISATGVRHGADVLPEAFPTIAEILRTAGYATAAFTTNGNAGPYSGTHQGFSFLYNRSRLDERTRPHDLKPDAGEVVGTLLRDWIHQNADRNFFLYVHTMDPHGPYDPPESYRHFDETITTHSPVERSSVFDPPWLPTPSRESRLALYDGEIAYGDFHFGRFLQMLEEAGVRDNTLLVFLSDHGEYFGEHEMWGHRLPPFVQGTHIPLLLVGPGIPSGVRKTETVQQLDILPTVLDALGFESDRGEFQGQSLLPLVQGTPSTFDKRLVFIEGASPGDVSFHYGSVHFVPKKNLILDLSEDPAEQSFLNEFALDFQLKSLSRRVASQYVQTFETFHSLFVPSTGDTVDVDPATLDQLRSLGYLN